MQRGIQIGSFLAGLGQRVDIGLGGVQLALQGGILAGGLLTGLGQRVDIGLGGVQLALQRGVLSGSFLAGLGQRVDIGLGGIQIGLQLRGGLGRVGKLGGQVVFILLEAGIEAQQPNDNGQDDDGSRQDDPHLFLHVPFRSFIENANKMKIKKYQYYIFDRRQKIPAKRLEKIKTAASLR